MQTNLPEIERAILGTMLLDPLAVADASSQLTWSDFSLSSHQVIFRQMLELTGEVNPLTLLAAMKPSEVASVGGPAYIADLPTGIPRGFSIADYVRIVQARSLARRGIDACLIAQRRLEDPTGDVLDAMDELSRSLIEDRPEESISVWNAMPKALKALEESSSRVISTGIRELDDFTSGGMRTKELWIIGALPSRGKSSLARQLERGALWAGVPVHTHTIEMDNDSWLLYHAAVVGGVAAWKLRQPHLMPPADRHQLRIGAATVQNWPFMLDEVSKVHIDTLLAKSRLSVMRHKTRVVIVDYLQLLEGDEKEMRHRMATAARKLKQFAKTYDCCVVALSQLARRGDINSRPTMQDLKESGDLEAAGDVVLLNYMPVSDGHFTGEDEIIVGKQRQGAIGSIPMRYDTSNLTFRGR